MNTAAKFCIFSGLALVSIGLAIHFFGDSISRLGLGKLPGDISIVRPGYKIYFPLATSVLLSIVLSFILWIFRKVKS